MIITELRITITELRNGHTQLRKGITELRNRFQNVLRRSVTARNIYMKNCAGP